MRRLINSMVAPVMMALVIAACGGDSTDDTVAATEAPDTTVAAATTEAPDTTAAPATTEMTEAEGDLDGPVEPPELDPSIFDDSANVDNKYLPLTPGSQIVLEGFTIDFEEDEEIPHTLVFTTTGLTKEIAGVMTRVVWIEDFEEGELVEAEVAFFAQDVDGNVWNFGEYPEEYEEGELVLAPAWIPGVAGAKAGIHMPANPLPDTGSFPQGWGPEVEWWDRGRVFETGTETCVPVDCYEDVLIVDEFGLDEPTAFQVKYYAPGIGNVQVGFKGDDPSGETLWMEAHNMLTGADLEAANAAALELEARAYEGSEVYADTEPMMPG